VQSSVAILEIVLSQDGQAQSVSFMPGDAFFVFSLGGKTADSLPDKGGTVELNYDKPEYPFGKLYAGFDHIRLENVDPQFIQNLRRVYKDHRLYVRKIVEIYVEKDRAREEIELNPPLAFVYNRDVDWTEQRIALKYNEDWPHLPADAFAGPNRKLLSDRSAAIYQPLIKTFAAVEADWGGARRFKPLKVQVPQNIAWGKWGIAIKEPIVAQCDDVQIIVAADQTLENYFLRKPEAKFYQITSEGIRICRWQSEEEGGELIKKGLGEDDK
jgi:hypothetical protein